MQETEETKNVFKFNSDFKIFSSLFLSVQENFPQHEKLLRSISWKSVHFTSSEKNT